MSVGNAPVEDENFNDAQGPDVGGEVLRVGIRLTPFWPEEPALWLTQVESQFVLSRITSDETKFYYLISQLDHQYATEVKDIIMNPPATDKYSKLKTELIKRLSASAEKRIKQFVMHEEIGDRKPSQFLRYLEGLAGPSVTKEFLANVWSQRLPQSIQTVIASQVKLPLDQLAELADKIYDIAPPVPQVSSTSTAALAPSYESLAKQVCELTRQVPKLHAWITVI
ncbi:uncharacterized protein LOC121735862 [Aricia agestis]|uniref:uncharacterized protein LOC121735862 n=1 Tax=Aricia agestis TaxID=91739 RepID=UPI001C208575|nr:uncharacterized protein LOC121735862 [Aricia agestis]